MSRRVPLRQSLFLFALLGVPYFATTIANSVRRHLWNDELFTYYFSHLPGLVDVWRELKTGIEQTPPLFYVVTRTSLDVFGDDALAIRLPEVLGVFAACCCLYLLVARRTSVAGGAVAALIVLATKALPYGYEARPYGLVLGLAAAALLCQQLRADTGSRAAALGVAVALAAAVSTHYYAVLLVVPLAVAELVRAFERRRLDHAIVAAFVVGIAPLAAFKPLIDGAHRYSGSFWTTFDWSSAWWFYSWLLRTPAVPPRIPSALLVGFTGAVVAASLALTAVPLVGGAMSRVRRSVDAPERAAAVALLLAPLLAVALAETVTGAYTERYTLFAVLGLAIVVPLGLDRLPGRLGLLTPLVAAILAIFFVRACVWNYRDVGGDLARQRETIAFLERSSPRLEIAVAHPHDFLELSHYAPPDLRARLRYLSSSALALRYLGTDSTENGLIVMSRFAPLHVRPYRTFVASGRPFLVFVDPGAGPERWLPRALAADGKPLRLLARSDGRMLYLVR